MREFGLIGRALGHSHSALYFEQKFRKEQINDCCYSIYELPQIGSLRCLLAEHPELCGFNVTIPYKQEIIPLLDAVSEEANWIGAVNCVRCESGRLTGYNTDIAGLRESLGTFIGVDRPLHALVLGTGGASQAVQYMLSQMEIPFDLVSRDPNRGSYTYDNLPCETVSESRLIVNTTPVGMYPDTDAAPRIPYAFISPQHMLFDVIYNPPLTQFLDYGRQRGARILNGEGMFIAQAEASWRIWNG